MSSQLTEANRANKVDNAEFGLPVLMNKGAMPIQGKDSEIMPCLFACQCIAFELAVRANDIAGIT